MIEANGLLAFGAALVKAIRGHIKYSSNMNDQHQLFDHLTENHIYEDLFEKYNIYRNPEFLTDRFINAQKCLELSAGLCDELSAATMYLAEIVESDFPETVYVTGISTYGHSMILIHQNEYYDNAKLSKEVITQNLDDLEKLLNFKNAVIVDPWVYIACRVSEIQKLKDAAINYNVQDYYLGEVYLEESMSSKVSALNTLPEHTDKYKFLINSFQSFYADQKYKLINHSDSFAIGQPQYDVRRNLQFNIQQQQLISLKKFIERLKIKSSRWYGYLLRGDIKINLLDSVTRYLEDCMNNYNYLDEGKLNHIFWATLRIIPSIIRKKTLRVLRYPTVHMTVTAKFLLSFDLILNNKQDFEYIHGLSFEWLRNIRNSHGNKKEYYYRIINIIYGENVDLHSLYTTEVEAFYYLEFQNAINKSRSL